MKSKAKRNIPLKIMLILIFIIIILGLFLGYKIIQDEQEVQNLVISNTTIEDDKTIEQEESPHKQTKIFQGFDRPFAIMIDNHSDAWPQAGLQKAYMVYEIIVEGGETRLMALFKGVDLEKVGPIRSARHYFIDYVLENDAIYVHFGQSPQAKSDIKKYNIKDINGIDEDGTTFWRTNDKLAPHNAVTNTKKLLESAKSKNYKTTSTQKSVLSYSENEVNLEDGQIANIVTIPHSTLQTVKYIYNEESKTYERYARNQKQTDWDTKNIITTKNIIITFCDNYDLEDTEEKGRQGLKNIGTFNGYYITNGKAIKIKCIKKSRETQTIYQDLDGNTIEVNDGNTFVNICPTDANVLIGDF